MEEQMRKLEEEIWQMKEVANEARVKATGELLTELRTSRELQSNTQEELKIKCKKIFSLNLEIERAKEFQLWLAEKEDSLGKLKGELNTAKGNEAQAMELLSNFKKRVHELEAEVESRRLFESKMFDSLVLKTKEFEQTSRHCDGSCHGKELGWLGSELGSAKANLAKTEEKEKYASSKAKALSDEMLLLRKELKLATDAEEKSQTEATVAKEKLSASQLELEQVKDEARRLKQMVRNTEARYQKLLDEAKQETLAQQETARLVKSLKDAKHMTRAAREEIYKLRDILKQVINEANVVKAAADLAKDENFQLKDSLAEKEERLCFLAREIGQVAKEIFVRPIELNRQESEDLEAKIQDEDPEKAEAPKQVFHHRRASSSTFSDDFGTPRTEFSDYSDTD
ncbi:PREDICTED: WEB family protein At5g16730, chloroplastic-like [Nicotiana attenuata]|uniref:Uncharacterized protein n=1 Tax=Nicotiana attenuata TaxID=49451 RepID=A0A1J6IEN9_NICAT|nr:PREDICTED: WEB family protein At5g16730, chloroplastic-like [Nicotiana attenuata]OIT03082.1 hypothetical protein A4A49_26255 [Nicotiana attenuata]